MALKITITNAGRAEIINANNTGTGPVEITHIAFTETAFTPSKTMTALPDEIKRVDSIAGEVVADDTISVTAKDEGPEAYTVRGFGLITEFGTLFAVYGQEEPIIEKSAPTTLLLTNDIIFADLPTASITFGDISFSNPPASLTTPGVVTLNNATDSTAQNQAATPLAVKTTNDNANTRLAKSQNLADLISAATARVNLGLGTSATLGNTASRTSASTTVLLQAAAMNDHRTSADHDDRYPQRANNLSDLPSPSQARSNLGLGASATMGTTAQRTLTATNILLQAKAMNDHRQSDDHDSRYPLKADVFPATVNISDWNDTPDYECFLYASSGSALNKPQGGGSSYGWQTSSGNGAYKHQFATGLASNTVFWRRKNNGVWDAGWAEYFHTGNLSPVETSRTVLAGNGLTGGGSLAANRQIDLGTPGTLSGNSVNGFPNGGHSHALAMATDAMAIAGTATSPLIAPSTLHAALNAFGIGVTAAPRINDDLNNPYPTGLYYAFGAANSPGNGYVLQQNFSTSYTHQTWFAVGSNGPIRYRTKVNGNWSSWREVYDELNLPTAFPRTGGTNGVQMLPNGFMFQYGYVDYVDFADIRTVPVTFNTTFPNQAVDVSFSINSNQSSVSSTQRSFTNAGFIAVVKEFDSEIAGGRIYWSAMGY